MANLEASWRAGSPSRKITIEIGKEKSQRHDADELNKQQSLATNQRGSIGITFPQTERTRHTLFSPIFHSVRLPTKANQAKLPSEFHNNEEKKKKKKRRIME